MTSPRALANQKLYHARILLDSWRTALVAQAIPATVLADAFDQAARNHLRQAYGWFLLEIIQSTSLPESPPENCDALPEIARGKVLPGEIRELRQLEQQGWLADMLRPHQAVEPGVKAAGSLALSVSEVSGPALIELWAECLQETFDRMADSLDEY